MIITPPVKRAPPAINLEQYSSAELYRKAAALWAKRKDTGLAIRMLRKAVQKDPRFVDAWLLLGKVFVSLGQTTDSQEAYCRAVTLAPNLREARLYCPRTSHEDWLKRKAREDARQKKLQTIQQKTVSANQLYKNRRYKEALSLYLECAQLDPSAPSVRYNLGLALYKLGRMQEAAQNFKQYLRDYPNYSDAREMLRKANNRLAYQRRIQKGRKAVESIVIQLGQEFDSASAYDSTASALSFTPPESPVDRAQRQAALYRLSGSRYASRALSNLESADVPPPNGYKDPRQRKRIIAAMSDEQLRKKISEMKRSLTVMKNSSIKDVDRLAELRKQAANAEKDALKHCCMLLLGSGLEKLTVTSESGRTLKFSAKRLLTIWGHSGPFAKAVAPDAGAREQLDLARSVMLDAYGTMAGFTGVLTTDRLSRIGPKGPQLAVLAAFFVDYSYSVSQWVMARNQLQAITDNLARPGGLLAAEKATSNLLEAMMEEQKQRAQRQ